MNKIIGNTVGTNMNPKQIPVPNEVSFGTYSFFAVDASFTARAMSVNGEYLALDSKETDAQRTKLLVKTPTEASQCANKGYVDNIVGNIETALDGVIALQNSLIGGDA